MPMRDLVPKPFATKCERAGMVWDPWVERYRVRSDISPERFKAPEIALPAVPMAWERPSILRPESPPPRFYQAHFLDHFAGRPTESVLLQSPTGSGKTFTALYAAAAHLERRERVVFIVPTLDLQEQTSTEARRLFGEDADFIRVMQGGKRFERYSTYDDPNAKLLIINGASLIRDLRSGHCKLADVGLLILDEGDLMRGEEPLAQIIRLWKVSNERPRTIVMSATLTVSDAAEKKAQEIRSLQRKTGIDWFCQLVEDRKNPYQVHTEKTVLPSDVELAVIRLEEAVWSRLASIRKIVDRFEDCEEQNKARGLLSDFYLSNRSGQAFVLPSVKLFTALPDVLKALRKTSYFWSEDTDNMVRLAYELQTLNHAHNLLATASRVNFLEYVGRIVYRCRAYRNAPKQKQPVSKSNSENGTRKTKSKKAGAAPGPHELALFPPGLLPLWWKEMAKGTPYELLAGVNSVARPADPVINFLRTCGIEAATHAQAEKVFFSSGKSLGVAALALMNCHFDEHPKIEVAINYLKGSMRRNHPGQALVYSGFALETRYLTEYLAKKTREDSVAIVGNAHTNRKSRKINYELARSGKVSLVCATSVVGRGVDLQALKYLILLDPPSDLRLAKQIFGRVGRGDELGIVVIPTTEGAKDHLANLARRAKAESEGVNFNEPKIKRRARRHKYENDPGLF